MRLFDAHCHFYEETLLGHWGEVAAACREVGIAGAVVNVDSERDWGTVEKLARENAWLLPAYGVHPWAAGNRSADFLEKLRRLLVADARASVGEIGLDRWMLERAREDDARLEGFRRAGIEEQSEVFAAQWNIARELGRTVSIHCIRAFGDLERVLRGLENLERGFLMHGYLGPAEMVDFFAERGAYFSFNAGCLRDVGKEELRRLVADGDKLPRRLEVWRKVPLERLLVETDAPAMPPPEEWSRFELAGDWCGARMNHPANLAVGYEVLALLRGVSVGELASRVGENFGSIFGV